VYHTLIQSRTATVKQTLALSLHEIARILGEKLVEEELVAVFEEMIQVNPHEYTYNGCVEVVGLFSFLTATNYSLGLILVCFDVAETVILTCQFRSKYNMLPIK